MNESIVLTMDNLEWVHAVFPQLSHSAVIKLASAGFVQKLGPRYFLLKLHSGAWFYLLFTTVTL